MTDRPAHPSDFDCHCTPLQWCLLGITEGQITLTCTNCDKAIPYADWWGVEALSMDRIPVALTVHVERSGSEVDYVWAELEVSDD